jgi:Flp pilus assembly pilin Flp
MYQLLPTIHIPMKLVPRAEDGQALTEYVLILSFITLVAILALTFLGSDISKLIRNAAEAF